MILKRKLTTILLSAFAVLFICIITAPKEENTSVNAKFSQKPQIILDAGHAALENTID